MVINGKSCSWLGLLDLSELEEKNTSWRGTCKEGSGVAGYMAWECQEVALSSAPLARACFRLSSGPTVFYMVFNSVI